MEKPERMLDQAGSPLERALLQEGRSYRAPEELRAHTLAAMGLLGTGGLATGGALAWLAAKSWTTKLLLATSTATLLMAIPVGYITLRKGTGPAVALPSLPAVAPSFHEPLAPNAPAVEAPTPSPGVAATTPATGRAPAPSASSALRAELAALDAVRTTLANGDSVGALAFLDAYFRTFPRGRLHL